MLVRKTQLEKLRDKVVLTNKMAMDLISSLEKQGIEECHCERNLGIYYMPQSFGEWGTDVVMYCMVCGGIVNV